MGALDALLSLWQRTLPALRRIQDEPSGRGAAATVLLVCAVASAVVWLPLGLVWDLLANVLPAGDCRGVGEPLRSVCAVKVALLVIAAPVAVLGLMYLGRAAVLVQLDRVRARVPPEAELFAAPVAATLFFALVWSGTHARSSGGGILPDPVFPALIGLFVFAAARFGHALDDQVTRLPLPAGWTRAFLLRLAVGGPIVLLVLLGSDVRDPAVGARQQLVVLLALATAYVATRRIGSAEVSG